MTKRQQTLHAGLWIDYEPVEDRRRSPQLPQLEPMAARQGMPASFGTFECQHSRPFEADENWVCLACNAIPPTHVEMLERARQRDENKRRREAELLKMRAAETQKQADKQRRRLKKRHAA